MRVIFFYLFQQSPNHTKCVIGNADHTQPYIALSPINYSQHFYWSQVMPDLTRSIDGFVKTAWLLT